MTETYDCLSLLREGFLGQPHLFGVRFHIYMSGSTLYIISPEQLPEVPQYFKRNSDFVFL